MPCAVGRGDYDPKLLEGNQDHNGHGSRPTRVLFGRDHAVALFTMDTTLLQEDLRSFDRHEDKIQRPSHEAIQLCSARLVPACFLHQGLHLFQEPSHRGQTRQCLEQRNRNMCTKVRIGPANSAFCSSDSGKDLGWQKTVVVKHRSWNFACHVKRCSARSGFWRILFSPMVCIESGGLSFTSTGRQAVLLKFNRVAWENWGRDCQRTGTSPL